MSKPANLIKEMLITFDLELQIKFKFDIQIDLIILQRQDFIEKKWRKTCFLLIFFFKNSKNFLHQILLQITLKLCIF